MLENAYQRSLRASVLLLTDDSEIGQKHLHRLIDNELFGEELEFAIIQAEEYLREKGETL